MVTILGEEPGEINPVLAAKQLAFYGSYVDLKKEDKVNCLENELVRDYHMRLNENEKEKTWAINEHRIIKQHFNEMAELADQRYVENNELKAELKRLQMKHDTDMKDWEHHHRLEMEIQKDNYERQLD
jgi:hypothetical protein